MGNDFYIVEAGPRDRVVRSSRTPLELDDVVQPPQKTRALAPRRDARAPPAGTCECTQNISGSEVSVCPTLGAGAFFGELALLKDAPRAASVTAASALATLRIDRPTFKRMIGDLAAIKKDYSAYGTQ